MTNQEAISTIETAIAEVEWEYPLDYAIAFEKAIEALQNGPKTLGDYTLKQVKQMCNDCHDCPFFKSGCGNIPKNWNFPRFSTQEIENAKQLMQIQSIFKTQFDTITKETNGELYLKNKKKGYITLSDISFPSIRQGETFKLSEIADGGYETSSTEIL
jgi:hypothetical protein